MLLMGASLPLRRGAVPPLPQRSWGAGSRTVEMEVSDPARPDSMVRVQLYVPPAGGSEQAQVGWARTGRIRVREDAVAMKILYRHVKTGAGGIRKDMGCSREDAASTPGDDGRHAAAMHLNPDARPCAYGIHGHPCIQTDLNTLSGPDAVCGHGPLSMVTS